MFAMPLNRIFALAMLGVLSVETGLAVRAAGAEADTILPHSITPPPPRPPEGGGRAVMSGGQPMIDGSLDPVGAPSAAPIRASGNYFTQDQRPFFWVADTAWDLLKIPRPDIVHYLEARREQGFNAIQGPILVGLTGNNFNEAPKNPTLNDFRRDHVGNLPFKSLDPIQLNDAYWETVDFIVQQATQRGFQILPAMAWGSTADIVFRSPAQAAQYAAAVASRYRSDPNVHWIVLGEYQKIAWERRPGDRKIPNAYELSIVNAMGRAAQEHNNPEALVTIHPDGAKSTSGLHGQPWLDFNTVQSWNHVASTVTLALSDFAREPPKPTILAETVYEDAKVNPVLGTAWDMRRYAYGSAFAGSASFTYGHWNVWQFGTRDNRGRWKENIDEPGAREIAGPFRALMNTFHTSDRRPANDLVTFGSTTPGSHGYVGATQSHLGGYIMVYSASGSSFDVNTRSLGSGDISARWFDPRTGRATDAGMVASGSGVSFDPPGDAATGNDYVLILQ